MLVDHPDAHPLPGGHSESGEPLGQLTLEDLGFGRVFFDVSLARHFQDSADFSQPVIGSFEGHLDAVLGRQPGSDLLGPLPAPLAQPGLELPAHFVIERGLVAGRLGSFQQARDPALAIPPRPTPHRRARPPHRLGDLFHRVVPAHAHAHGLQLFPFPRVLGRALPRPHRFHIAFNPKHSCHPPFLSFCLPVVKSYC